MTRRRAIPLPSAGTIVEIRYRRLGRPTETYRQQVLESGARGIVTFQPRTPIDAPLAVADANILEPGSPVIWFTFPHAWHDIGLFHLADGTPTGLYANVLTPVDFVSQNRWETTDLCLDVWVPRRGAARLLDTAELADAEAEGLVASAVAVRAREEAKRLMAGLASASWPPVLVSEWSLARAPGALGAENPTRHSSRESASPPESSPGRRR
ncbi:MAG: DUF402 domain-containing protein [Gemmatimonadota bacterium]|nr:DUF402 domain-containing protein [Gemmatimonadota bacterium]